MAYAYERLSPERFLGLCRGLLEEDFPAIEVLELGSQDAGRLGLERSPIVTDRVVLQAVYAHGGRADSGHRLLELLKGELPRIGRLAEQGAIRYIMATNAEGPSPDSPASAAQIHRWLAEHCPVPFDISWRQDLDRRMDWVPARKKLRYPEVLSEQDAIARALSMLVPPSAAEALDQVLELLRAGSASEEASSSGIRNPVARFVDIPVAGERAAAAELLLSDGDAERPAGTCVTGEAGSGKSALLDYVAHVQRARLLGDVELLSRLPQRHTAVPFRLPLLIDAQDCIAVVASDGGPVPAERDATSLLDRLAQFLSARGGDATPAALRGVLTSVPALVMLDGIDQIGNPRLRRAIADSVLTSVEDLRNAGADIRFVAAARGLDDDPAPSRLFSALRILPLDPLDRARITEVNDRWALERRLSTDETERVRAELDLALEADDAHELAGTPGQLETMIGILERGGSPLPAVRSDPYSELVRQALAESAESVRLLGTRRYLLAEVLEHLAWVAQMNAESDGIVALTHARTAELVDEFLRIRREPSGIAGALLTAVLGSPLLTDRPDGSVTFAGQAMREFLCARHMLNRGLLDGSPGGSSGSDDMRSPLIVLLTNPFWTNVTRFYVQLCTSAGLSGVAEALHQLIRSPDLATALRGRRLSALLLADRAFRRRRDLQEELTRAVYDRVGMRLAAVTTGLRIHSRLAPDSGQDVLQRTILGEHVAGGDKQSALTGAALLAANGGENLWEELRDHVRASSGAERTMRLTVLFRSRAQESAPVEDIEAVIYEDEPSPRERYFRLTALMDSGSTLFSRSHRLAGDLIGQLLRWGPSKSAYSATPVTQFANVLAGGAQTVELIEGLPTATDYESAASAVEEIRAEFGDSWATYSLAASACGIPRHSGIESTPKSMMDPTLRLCDRALAARMWRGKSTWWVEQLGDARDDPERMFWIVVMVAWGSAQHVVENLQHLDAAVRNLDDDQFTVVTEAIRAALQSRKVHGGRPRPPIEAPDSVHDRTAVLLTVAFAPPLMRALPARRPDSPLIDEWARRTAVEERIGSFTTWDAMGDRAARQWAWAAAESIELGIDFPAHIEQRLKDQAMPAAVARHVLLADVPHPVALLEAALLSTWSAAVGDPVGPFLVDGWRSEPS